MAKYKTITVKHLFSFDEFKEMEQLFLSGRKDCCRPFFESKLNQLICEKHDEEVGVINSQKILPTKIYYVKDFFLGSCQSKYIDLNLIKLSTKTKYTKTICFCHGVNFLELDYSRWSVFNSSLFLMSK